VFEEGLQSAMTVRDFSIIFDSYSQYEETMLSAKMELNAEDEEEEEEEDEDDDLEEEGDDLEMRMVRFEHLIEKRPIMLSSVLLRQNPHNVSEWSKRTKLFTDPIQVIDCYGEAVKTIDPAKAHGKLHLLWGM
jgi:pre-mRNA-splicing factor SYF1